MSAFTRTPQNTNLLQPTKYLLTFSRIPNTQYFLQSVNLPGITAGQTMINTPIHDYYVAPTKMEHSNLNINFLLDESLQSWKDIYYWFRSIASPESIEERNRLRRLQTNKDDRSSYYSDGILTLLSNLNNPIMRIEFFNLFPISLSDIQFDTRQSADDTMTADATFVFEYFNFLPLN
jgi:hypothetical protein